VLPDPFYTLEDQIAIDLPGARAVFTGSSWGDVRQTRKEIERRLGVRSIFATQVHGNTVVVSEITGAGGQVSDGADALITRMAGTAPSVHTADCLPIALTAPGAVSAVHAGWRGLDCGVIDAAVRTLRRLTDEDAEVTAAIGPGAGACCYEVGPELHERFPAFLAGANLDLKAIARDQLSAAGVATIHDCGVCTICSTEHELFSYRREGAETGRQALFTWLS
jgi:YfiH family protein